MGTRQSSARLMGTSWYFSISLKTGSKFSPTSKATNRAAAVGTLPSEKTERNALERTASHVDQGGGKAEAWVPAHAWLASPATEQGRHKPRVNEDVSCYSPWLANRPAFAHSGRSVSHLPIR